MLAVLRDQEIRQFLQHLAKGCSVAMLLRECSRRMMSTRARQVGVHSSIGHAASSNFIVLKNRTQLFHETKTHVAVQCLLLCPSSCGAATQGLRSESIDWEFLNTLPDILLLLQSSLKQISPQLAEMMRNQVHRFLHKCLHLLLEPLGAEVAGELEAAFEPTFSDARGSEMMMLSLVRLFSHRDFRKLMKALSERQGREVFE